MNSKTSAKRFLALYFLVFFGAILLRIDYFPLSWVPMYGHHVAGTDLTLKFLNEEHGVIETDAPFDTLRIGERVRVIPNHACVVSNLFDVVHLLRGDEVVETVPVAARGRVD